MTTPQEISFNMYRPTTSHNSWAFFPSWTILSSLNTVKTEQQIKVAYFTKTQASSTSSHTCLKHIWYRPGIHTFKKCSSQRSLAVQDFWWRLSWSSRFHFHWESRMHTFRFSIVLKMRVGLFIRLEVMILRTSPMVSSLSCLNMSKK